MIQNHPVKERVMEDIAILRMIRRGLLLEYLTLGWNVVGTAILAFAAWKTGSIRWWRSWRRPS